MGCKIIERGLVNGFDWYGRLVGRYPAPFLLAPLIFSLLVAGGLLLMKTESNVVMLFTPTKAPSRREQAVAKEFLSIRPTTSNGSEKFLPRLPYVAAEDNVDLWYNVQAAYSDRRNLMNVESWDILRELTRYLYKNFTCTTYDGRILRYSPDFCDTRRGCLAMDEYVDRIADMVRNGLNKSSPLADRIRLSYPIMYVFDKPFNWAQLIYGVETNDTTRVIETARVVSLFFQFQYERKNAKMHIYAQNCMEQMTKLLYALRANKTAATRWTGGMEFCPLNERLMDTEVMRTKFYALPLLSATIILVMLCTVLSSLTPGFLFGSAFEALMGVICIGVSLLASFGFMFLCGRYFNAIVIIAPFLVMCVGIDNDFLLLAAYKQSDPKLPAHKRLGAAFADAGPSLTITSLNDILCFGVGFLSDTPSVANFCLYTCVTLTFRYVYQMTFFAAVMAYVGRYESKLRENDEKNECRWMERIVEKFREKDAGKKSHLDENSRSKKRIFKRRADYVTHRFFGGPYSRFLMRKPVQATAMLSYLAYALISLIYASKMRASISPQKLVVDDSPLLEYFSLAEKYSWSDAVLAHVFVTNPPDFRNRTEIDAFRYFVDAVSNIDEFRDRNVTTKELSDASGLWLDDYVPYLEFVLPPNDGSDYVQDFYLHMPEFLATNDYSKYWADLRFRKPHTNSSTSKRDALKRIRLDKMHFTAFYRGLDTWEKHVRLMLYWRRVCQNFSRYDAVIYDHHHLNIYLDQRLTLAPTTLQTSGIAILSVALVTAIFMPDAVSVFFISFSFLSVDIGVIGFLSMWGTELDPVTMVCVLMTIGFSVYYTARICYCYRNAAVRKSNSEKLSYTLGAVGWPITQGGLATLLGILPLAFVRSYMVRVFFKTIALMVIIGLWHGLFIMPVMMCVFDRKPNRRRQCRSEDSSSLSTLKNDSETERQRTRFRNGDA